MPVSCCRKNAGLSLAQEALHAGYDTDEEVYAAARAVDAGQVEYDLDDNPVVTLDKKKIEPLDPVDHTEVDYDDFAKDLYDENLEITAMSEPEVAAYRAQKGIRVSGFDVPRPIKSFQQAGFDEVLAGVIAKQGYETPTAIQCQALPVVLSGRDMIGIAKTGSGKTAAFVLPMVGHILDQVRAGHGAPRLAGKQGFLPAFPGICVGLPMELLVALSAEQPPGSHRPPQSFQEHVLI